MRRPLAVSAVLLATWTRSAAAAPLSITATPLLGADAPGNRGWSSYAVMLRGSTDGLERGTVVLTDGSGGNTRAPFAVAPGEQVDLELSWHDVFGKGIEVMALDDAGVVLARTTVPSARSRVPLLFDLGRTERLKTALRDQRVAVLADAHPWAPAEGVELAVAHATVDARSGELLLPERALGYDSVTVTIAASDLLVSMPDKAFAALDDWVLGGGTLAVTVGRPDDVARGRLAALVGGPVTAAPSSDTARFVDFATAEEAPTAPGSAPPSATFGLRHVPPSTEVAMSLVGFTARTLRSTRWGAMTTHGLGEVHLLAFDPSAPGFVDDPWVRRSTVDLVRDAWERQAAATITSGASGFDESHVESLRRLLDPNESSRWAIGLAAALLVLYAILALPLSFRRAARKNDPLRAIIELPIWSAGTLALIVLVGAAAKGGRARARRISVVECGAAAPRGAVTRLRALFTSSADSLRVTATNASSLLDVSGAPNVTRSLTLDRDTAELTDLRGRPWETLLIREDGFTDLGGTIDLPGGLAVTNGLRRALVGVVARSPGGDLRYFSRIEPGRTVEIASGRPLGTPSGGGAPSLSSASVPSLTPFHAHRLESGRFAALVDATTPGSSELWSALESLAAESADFWPDGAATLIGEIDGGDGAREDSGLPMDRDRSFIRVVGPRGAP